MFIRLGYYEELRELFLQFPFFMHFFKINIGFFDFCIKYVLNITVTNEFIT